MFKFGKTAAVILSAALCVGLFASCTPKEEMTKLRVSEVTHSIFYAPSYVALNEGYFADEGLEIELLNGGGADKVMTAVLSGSVDIGFSGPEAAIYVYNEGKEDYCEVFAQVTKRDGSFLVGREPAEEFEWENLRDSEVLPGRKGGVPSMTFLHVLKQKGFEPGADLIFNDSIQFDLMAGAFSSGTGDYVTAFEPVASSLEAEGKGYIVASVGEESGEIPYTAYYATKNYIKENSDIIERFTRAIKRGEEFVAEKSAQEIAKAIAPSFKETDLETLTKVVARYKEIDAWCAEPFMKEEAFEKLQDVMTEAGELQKRADYKKVVNNSFAEKVNQE